MSKLISKKNIENRLAELSPKQIMEIRSVLTDACLAAQYGTDYKNIILRAKNKRKYGKLRDIYNFLDKLDLIDLEIVAEVFTEPPEPKSIPKPTVKLFQSHIL